MSYISPETEYFNTRASLKERAVNSLLDMVNMNTARTAIEHIKNVSSCEMNYVASRRAAEESLSRDNSPVDIRDKILELERIKFRVNQKIEYLLPWILTKELGWDRKSPDEKQAAFESVKLTIISAYSYADTVYTLMHANIDESEGIVCYRGYTKTASEYDTYLSENLPTLPSITL